MEARRLEVPANVGSSLEHLREMQGIVEPRVVDLHHSSRHLLEAESGKALSLRPGRERLTDATTACEFEGKIYTVRAFARLGQKDAFGSREVEAGLRFFPPDYNRTNLYAELTFYEKGVILAGLHDKDDQVEIDATATISFAHILMTRLERSIQQASQAKQASEEHRARTRHRFMRRAIALGGVALAIGGGIYGASTEPGRQVADTAKKGAQQVINIFRGRANKFDDHRYRLPGGNTGQVNESIAPAFSDDLYNDRRLAVTEVPRVNHKIPGDFGSKYPFDDSLATNDGLREIILTSSQEDMNCETAEVDYIRRDSQIIAWTDFVGTGGNSRADELTIRLVPRTTDTTTPSVEACWHGKELSDEDDPRIVFDIK